MIADILEIAIGGIPVLAAGGVGRYFYKHNKKVNNLIAEEFDKIEQEKHWYDLVRGLGKADFELLTAGVIDIAQDENGNYTLERNDAYGWDVKSLMGEARYDRLMREWYPERYCKYCNKEGCKEECSHGRRANQLKRDMARSQTIASLEYKKAEWVAQNKPKRKSAENVLYANNDIQFTTIRNLRTGLSGYKIVYKGRVTELGTTDVKRFQQNMRLTVSGSICSMTQRVMTRVLKHGLPLTTVEHVDGFKWYIKQAARQGVIKVVASNSLYTVEEEMLEESAADLMKLDLVLKKIKDKLDAKKKEDRLKNQRNATTFSDLDKMIEKSRRELDSMHASMSRWDREVEETLLGHRNKYHRYNEPYDDCYRWDGKYFGEDSSGYYLD